MATDTPITLENAIKVVRPTLGTDAPISLFRIFRLVVLEQIVGVASASTAYLAGKKLGESLQMESVEKFLEFCQSLKLGNIKIPTQTDQLIHVDVHECVTCSGMTPVGRTLCHFEGGLISGAIKHILKRDNRTKEVTCIGGLGDETCGFDIELL